VFSDEVFRVNQKEQAQDANTLESKVDIQEVNEQSQHQTIHEGNREKRKIPNSESQEFQVSDIETHSKLLAKLCYFLNTNYKKKLQNFREIWKRKGIQDHRGIVYEDSDDAAKVADQAAYNSDGRIRLWQDLPVFLPRRDHPQ
jgi:hypothetical protein